MNTEFLIWLLSAGIAQGLFLSFGLLFLKVKNKTATWLLAVLVVIMTMMIASEFLDIVDAPVSFAFGMTLELAIGPLIYLFILAVSDPAFHFDRRAAAHLAPFLAAVVAFSGIQVTLGSQFLTMSNASAAPYVTLWALLKIPYFAAYAWHSLVDVSQALAKSRRKRHAALLWLRHWLIVLYAVAALIYLNFLLFLAGLPAVPDPDVLAALLLSAVVYSVAYLVIFNRQILDSRVEIDKDDPELMELGHWALSWLDGERPYLNPDFSLAEFAAALRVDDVKLSKSLAAHFDGGFVELLNSRRIAAYDQLLIDPKNEACTILELAFNAGFNSKATFYRIFKAAKGITPTAHRKEIIEKMRNSASHQGK